MGPLKEQYEIPENEAAQSAHNQRLRGEFRAAQLIPLRGDLDIAKPEEMHDFDRSVRAVVHEGKINLTCLLGGKNDTRKRRISDDI